MNKSKKLNKKIKTRKNKYGGKMTCTQKCKDKYYKLLKKYKSPKIDNYKNFLSYLGVKKEDFDKKFDEEIKKALNKKETQNDPAFKLCISDCEKSRK
jgi:hypothetical protein